MLPSTSTLPSEDTVNYFTCKICFKIVNDPKMCKECETPYCDKCIKDWYKNSRYEAQCPAAKCRDAKYINLPEIVTKMLQGLRFFCPHEGCAMNRETYLQTAISLNQPSIDPTTLGQLYKRAVTHTKHCNYIKVVCP